MDISDPETDEEPAVLTVFRPPIPSRGRHGKKRATAKAGIQGQLSRMW